MLIRSHATAAVPRLGDGSLPRVILADADLDERSLYSSSLHAAGCDVAECDDGRDALAKALSRRPSLVITDAALPFIDGFALCELLRRDPATTSVPIILVGCETGAAGIDDVGHGRAVGADMVAVKGRAATEIVADAIVLMKESLNLKLRSKTVIGRLAKQLKQSADLLETVAQVRAQAHAARRQHATATPPLRPPALVCPSCDRALAYQHSFTGGVGRGLIEQWDYFKCAGGCGTLQYRHRTRTLRFIR
jgi:DNA-binding response OmpR family regulator